MSRLVQRVLPYLVAFLAGFLVMFVFYAAPAAAREAADCVVKYALSGPVCVDRAQATGFKQARYFGTYTKAPKSARKTTTTVAGKTFTPSPSVSYYSSAAPWLADAQRYVGKGNPTTRKGLWCARFINDRLVRSGRRGTGSDLARSFVNGGQRLAAPRPGAIAVYTRGRNGGHAAIVESVEGNTVTLISGNCNGGVCRYTRSIGAAIAYVWPS